MSKTNIIIYALFVGGLIGWLAWLLVIIHWYKTKQITVRLINDIQRSINILKKEIKILDR